MILMNTIQRIAKNTIVLIISNIIGKVLGFFFIMYTARYLGAGGFGVLSFAIAIVGLFAIFSDIGLSTLITREVARDKTLANKYVDNVVALKVLLVVLTFGLIALVINILGYPWQTIEIVYIIGLSMVFNAFTGTFNSIFQAFEKMEYTAIGGILNSALLLGGALFVIWRGYGLVSFAIVYLLGSATVLLYSFVISIRRFVIPRLKIELHFWRSLVVSAIPFSLIGVFAIIYMQIDIVMLSKMQGNEVVGWYSASYQLIRVLAFIPAFFMAAVFPVFSKLYYSSKNALMFGYKKSCGYLFIVAFPIAVGTMLLADRIILLIFGSEYAPAIIALQILIWVAVFSFVNWVFATVMNSINKQGILAFIFALTAIFNVFLNLILIPKISYIGASIASVASEVLLFILAFYFVSKYLCKLALHKMIIRPIIAGLLMGGFILIFIKLNLGLLILLSALVYFIALYLMRGFSKEDVEILKAVVTRVS
jgi:O-antigen/teichoic acid export membrane protein